MKLFWKIYLGILVSVVAVAYALVYLSSVQQVAALEERIVEENQAVAAVLAKEIEVAQLTLHWPFASLDALTQRRDFLFWWTVEDGTIRVANDAAFMGTRPPDDLPRVDLPSSVPQLALDHSRSCGLVVYPVRTPHSKMTFWLGFSLKSVRESRDRLLLLTTAVALGALVLLGAVLYMMIRHLMKPLQELKAGAQIIGRGTLSHRIAVRSRDEIGELVESFNQMTASLERTTVSKDYVDAIVTELVDALLVFDTKGTIVTANPGARELLGYTEGELVGQPIDLVIDAGDAAVQPASILEKAGLRNHETTYRRKDGSRVPVLFGASLLTLPDDRVYIVSTGRDISERKREEEVRERLIAELQESMAKVKTLRGLIPICAACKKIRDDQGYWNQIETYVRDHSEAEFSHGICPDCFERLYPGYSRTKAGD